MKTIAVEDTLTNVREFLKSNGYRVVRLAGRQEADAYVVNGMDNNLMGMQDRSTKAPVIDASGKTPEQVLNSLQYLS